MVFTAGGQGGRRPGWPATLGPLDAAVGKVGVRPLRRGDGRRWRELRLADEHLIAPWEATSPLNWADRHTGTAWQIHRSFLVAAARRGETLPFAITVDDDLVGQVTLGGIQRGAVRSGWVGYWVSSRCTGRGVASTAVAMVVVHALTRADLHRVEATIAPANLASQRVVAHLGFRQEGLLQRYLDIDGAWRDHLLFALTAEELPDGPAVRLAAGISP